MSLNSLGGIMTSEGTLDTESPDQGARLVSNQPGALHTRWTPVMFGVACLIAETRRARERRLHDNLHSMGIDVAPNWAAVGDA